MWFVPESERIHSRVDPRANRNSQDGIFEPRKAQSEEHVQMFLLCEIAGGEGEAGSEAEDAGMLLPRKIARGARNEAEDAGTLLPRKIARGNVEARDETEDARMFLSHEIAGGDVEARDDEDEDEDARMSLSRKIVAGGEAEAGKEEEGEEVLQEEKGEEKRERARKTRQ